MNYQEALKFLESPSRFSPRLGLERIGAFLEALGSPQETFPSILIGGTSGKGSSCKMIESVLKEAGFKVGLFTKPHLQTYRERIAIGDDLISKEELTSLVEEIVPIAENIGKTELGFPTYFEMGVALAFKYFAQKKVDIAVVEVGMGGRFDATNVLKPIICGITEIGFDHEKYLGNTLSQIAFEKAGIIKPGTPVVVSRQEEEAMEVLMRVAEERGAPLLQGAVQAEGPLSFSLAGQTINLKGQGGVLEEIFLPLLGEHQISNAAFALACLQCIKEMGFSWTEGDFKRGVAGLRWPGRIEILSQSPLIVIDGAHNPSKAGALSRAIKECFQFKRLIIVMGVSRDKDLKGILLKFKDFEPLILASAASSGRGFKPAEIVEGCQGLGIPAREFPGVSTALQEAIGIAREGDLILVTGSIYVAGEARDLYFKVE
ncbi:MAG: bifunctional folylpolyglutamate synthase/dihydrofolate synthase [Caldiserica bacterium]|jgi:dihydrofolate synthase/folylpolyglutamate synthase|nr:bifunctional folylpolyglutamate synthase/dihydrofolate synthase [Caldisericota bacterium]MDH7562135.1 folylpolyglutamate synthase/dihydrofolate synthase family protein [Caldisericota bacterium]